MSNTAIVGIHIDEVRSVKDFGSCETEVSPETMDNQRSSSVVYLNYNTVLKYMLFILKLL